MAIPERLSENEARDWANGVLTGILLGEGDTRTNAIAKYREIKKKAESDGLFGPYSAIMRNIEGIDRWNELEPFIERVAPDETTPRP
jgi:hypothetical protein